MCSSAPAVADHTLRNTSLKYMPTTSVPLQLLLLFGLFFIASSGTCHLQEEWASEIDFYENPSSVPSPPPPPHLPTYTDRHVNDGFFQHGIRPSERNNVVVGNENLWEWNF